MLAWHNSAKLKAEVLAEMKRHREQDEIALGVYQVLAPEKADGFKGCAIGCLVATKRPPLEHVTANALCDIPDCTCFRYRGIIEPDVGWHNEVQRLYGIPRDIAAIIDNTFESHDTLADAANFAIRVIESIPVGADLSAVANLYYQPLIDTDPNASFLSLLENAPIGVPDNG